MKNLLLTILWIGSWAGQLPGLHAQGSSGFKLSLEEWPMPDAPGVQSFALGRHNGYWLVLGGRRDGLHRPQPFAAFDPVGHNVELFVLDPEAKQVWKQGLEGFPVPLLEQLQSTNMQFLQRDSTLYLIGGYAYSSSKEDFTTFPLLTAVDVPACIRAMMAGQAAAPHFRFLEDERMRVTGGQLGLLDGEFFLVGGQDFEGVYNPIGPDNGPGFFQAYTNAIRRFRIDDNGTQLSIRDYAATVDSLLLHRRDYNMVEQLFPGGQQGFTLFSGVFQYNENIPWLNLVDVTGNGYREVPVFEQLYSHYHSAKMPIYDSQTGRMHTVFFGGMARYYPLPTGGLMDDLNVPFVKTISRVTRFPNDSLVEYDTGLRMPGFLGATAEFIHAMGNPYLGSEILDLAGLPLGRHFVGYIYGGLECQEENIFFSSTGVESWASNKIFKVYLEKLEIYSAKVLQLEIYSKF